MKIITYIYIFALYILFTPGFLRKTKLNIQTYLIYSLLFAFIMYLTFDLINQKNVESYNKYDVDVKGVNSLVDLIKTQFGGSSGEKKIDIHNQIAGSNGNSNINCWNALGKNQKELEIIKVQLDSFAGTKTDIDKLNNQLNTLKQEVDGLDDKLIGSAGTDKEVDGLNLQIKNYQGEIDKLEQQIKLYNETDEDIKKINNQISKLQSEITGLNLKITDCTNINGEKTGTINTLNATINGQNTTITSLQSRINSREGCPIQLDVNPDIPVNGVSWSRVIPAGAAGESLVKRSGHYYLNYWDRPAEIRFNRPIRFMSFKGHIQPWAGYGFNPSSSNILTLIYKNNGVEVGNQTIYADQMPSNTEYTLGTINSTYSGLIDSIAIPARPSFWPTFTNFTVSN